MNHHFCLATNSVVAKQRLTLYCLVNTTLTADHPEWSAALSIASLCARRYLETEPVLSVESSSLSSIGMQDD